MPTQVNSNHKMTKLSLTNYKILRILGKGSFGKVYLIQSKLTNEYYAMKQISKENMTRDDRTRINREIELLSKVSHPNIVQMKQLIVTSSYYLIIMEYCSNGELFNYIVRKQLLNDNEASVFFYQIISAISYLHSISIIHRDIKPENILISSNNEIKLIDFGLSNYIKQDGMLSTSCGSPCYAAPEMLRNIPYKGEPCDIWSVGVILYAMLCGYLPFQCEDERGMELYYKIVNSEYVIPKWISLPAKYLIERMLIINPDRRITLEEILDSSFYQKGRYLFYSKNGKKEHIPLRFSFNFERVDSIKEPEEKRKYIYVKRKAISTHKKTENKAVKSEKKEIKNRVRCEVKNVVINDLSACIDLVRRREKKITSAFNFELLKKNLVCNSEKKEKTNRSCLKTKRHIINNSNFETSAFCVSSSNSSRRSSKCSILDSYRNKGTPVKKKVYFNNINISCSNHSRNKQCIKTNILRNKVLKLNSINLNNL